MNVLRQPIALIYRRPKRVKGLFFTRPGVFEDGELVVLTNSMSASASDFCRSYSRLGSWISDRTADLGKGLVQEEFTPSNGDVMRLPVSKYYMPSGRCVQKPYEGKTP